MLMLMLLLGAVGSGQIASAADRIVPVRERVFLSSHPRWSRWSVPVRAADGATIYLLALEPRFDRRRRVTAVALTLRYPGDGAEAPNLLAPTGNWHGLQPFDFPASDLAHGAEQAAFGRTRKIFASRVGLVLRIALLEAGVKPIPKGEFELEKLSLSIEIDDQAR